MTYTKIETIQNSVLLSKIGSKIFKGTRKKVGALESSHHSKMLKLLACPIFFVK